MSSFPCAFNFPSDWKYGIKRVSSQSPQYQDAYGVSNLEYYSNTDKIQLENTGFSSNTNPSETNYITPITSSNLNEGLTPELVGTAKIIEVTDINSIPSTQKCALGDGNFEDYNGRVFKCSVCGTLYHEQCLNVQLMQGICKTCERIFLY